MVGSNPFQEPDLSSSFWLCFAKDKRESIHETLSTMWNLSKRHQSLWSQKNFSSPRKIPDLTQGNFYYYFRNQDCECVYKNTHTHTHTHTQNTLLVKVGFLLYLKKKNFLRPTREDGGFAVWFIDDAQLRGFHSWLPNIPSLFFSPWKKSSLVFSRAKMKVTAPSSCSILKYSPVWHPAGLKCVSSCSPWLCCGIHPPFWSLHVQSPQP